jgi:copper chaperone CopZ
MTVQRLNLGLTAPAAGCSGDACVCGSADDAAAVASATGTDVIAQLSVEGMTCGHCVRAVTAEISALDGVSDVEVELVAGGTSRVTVRGSAPVPDDALRDAVAEAGYSLAG